MWETIGLMRGEIYTDVNIVFEDVRFHRATNISKDGMNSTPFCHDDFLSFVEVALTSGRSQAASSSS